MFDLLPKFPVWEKKICSKLYAKLELIKCILQKTLNPKKLNSTTYFNCKIMFVLVYVLVLIHNLIELINVIWSVATSW